MILVELLYMFFFFKQKTAYEMRISDWSSDVCSSDLALRIAIDKLVGVAARQHGEPHQLLGNIDNPVIIARRQHAACLVELRISFGNDRLVGDGDHPHTAAEDAQSVDAVERLRSRRDLHHGESAALRGTQTYIGERQVNELRCHYAGDLAVALGAAPDLAI